jgi:isoaspartyl peptidase/L-asparaginase-like protein (Ntn-hydrolase superfamily)
MPELLLSTWSFGAIANAAAIPALAAGGSALDAVVAGATAVEADERVDSVGVGGTPDADGDVSLDACVMTDPEHCGSVACVRGYANPTALARRVMEKTIHVLLVGDGAEKFAAREGFTRRSLLTDAARARWTKWRDELGRAGRSPYEGWVPPRHVEPAGTQSYPEKSPRSHDTIGLLARDRRGQLAGACSSSGMAFKVPGRVGDSPIIGHGLYVDQRAGAAVATGNGELIMGACGSFLAVELMRQGWSPQAACVEVVRRIAARKDILPDHHVAVIAIASAAAGGGWASVALRPGFVHVVSDAAGTRVEPPHAVLRGH